MRILTMTLFALALAGCEYLQKGSGAIADGIDAYCGAQTDAGRELVRAELAGELKAEDAEICLGCKGDSETVCVGAHRTKVDANL